jgi:hypothetical protein
MAEITCHFCRHNVPSYYVGEHPLSVRMDGTHRTYEPEQLCMDCYLWFIEQKYMHKNERSFVVEILGMWCGIRVELPVRMHRLGLGKNRRNKLCVL